MPTPELCDAGCEGTCPKSCASLGSVSAGHRFETRQVRAAFQVVDLRWDLSFKVWALMLSFNISLP